MTNVLIVDDTSTNLKILEILLKKQGCLVSSFAKPNEALKWLRASSTSIDLAILDYEMPEMNGSQLAMELRKSGFSGNCLILTALGSLDLEQLPHEAKINSILNKPINLTDVSYILKRWGEKSEQIDCRSETRRPSNEDSEIEAYLFQNGIYHAIVVNKTNSSERGIGLSLNEGEQPKPGSEVMLLSGQNYSVRWVRTLKREVLFGLCRIERVEGL